MLKSTPSKVSLELLVDNCHDTSEIRVQGLGLGMLYVDFVDVLESLQRRQPR